jgi:hypothetical protein
MAKQYEYKSILRQIRWTDEYPSCADVVNPEADDDWELINVNAVVDTFSENKIEIFYFRRHIINEPYAEQRKR